ncbi:hypothetical protein BDQ17DRAFT_1428913 [Cyathus striatus]|nr:hypothetical protein BDQ17DRAFT_1428913 [Cyathus striatus]
MSNVIVLNHLSVHSLSSPQGAKASCAAPTESELIEDLNLSKCDEPGAVYKPNPFSIAKINAATRAKGGDAGTSNASKPGFKPQMNVWETKHSAQLEGMSKQSMRRKGSGKGTMKKKLLLKTGLQRKGSFHTKAITSAIGGPHHAHAPFTSETTTPLRTMHIPDEIPSNEPISPSIARSSKAAIFSALWYTPPGAGHKVFATPASAIYASEHHPSRTTSKPFPSVLVPPPITLPPRLPAPLEHLLYHPLSSPQISAASKDSREQGPTSAILISYTPLQGHPPFAIRLKANAVSSRTAPSSSYSGASHCDRGIG